MCTSEHQQVTLEAFISEMNERTILTFKYSVLHIKFNSLCKHIAYSLPRLHWNCIIIALCTQLGVLVLTVSQCSPSWPEACSHSPSGLFCSPFKFVTQIMVYLMIKFGTQNMLPFHAVMGIIPYLMCLHIHAVHVLFVWCM